MKDLKERSIKGIGWDLAGTISNQGVSFVISIFLARLLLPEEFGLVGMALVFISIFSVLADFGFSSALIQSKENSSLTYSTIFYINLAAGIALFVGFQFLAPYIGAFYGNDEVEVLIRWLALGFIFRALNAVQTAILNRDIDFKTLTIRQILANSFGGIAGILMAFNGFGVYSLIAQYLLGHLVTSIFLWRVTDWRPRLEFSVSEVSRLSSFSLYMFFNNAFGQVFNRMDVLFIGKIFSPASLGFYTRAQSMNTLVTNYSSTTINKVFFPVLSSLQDSGQQFLRAYEKAIAVICFMAFGMTGVLYVMGENLILGLFGSQWGPSVFIFKVLILKAMNYPMNSMIKNAFLSKGKAKENFWVGIFRKTIGLIPFAVGYYYGLHAFVVSLVGVSYLLTFLNIFFLKRFISIPLRLHFSKILEGAIPVILLILFYNQFGQLNVWANIAISIVFIVVYLTYSIVTGNMGFEVARENVKPFWLKVRQKFI